MKGKINSSHPCMFDPLYFLNLGFLSIYGDFIVSQMKNLLCNVLCDVHVVANYYRSKRKWFHHLKMSFSTGPRRCNVTNVIIMPTYPVRHIRQIKAINYLTQLYRNDYSGPRRIPSTPFIIHIILLTLIKKIVENLYTLYLIYSARSEI